MVPAIKVLKWLEIFSQVKAVISLSPLYSVSFFLSFVFISLFLYKHFSFFSQILEKKEAKNSWERVKNTKS